MPSWPVTVHQGAAIVEIAEAVYPTAAVHGAAVVFIDRAWLRVSQPAPGRARIELRPKEAATEEQLRALGGDLLDELLHQALRADVGARTEKLRELVIGKAVLATEGDVGGAVEFHDDPLGIARPWEERYLGEGNGGRK